MRHKCGVFGIYGPEDAAALTALGLHALQHRGQEACGITTYNKENNSFHIERHLGLVGDNFGSERDAIKRLEGSRAIGHNRYSTSGGLAVRNIQPIYADLAGGGFALAHNGNLANAIALRRTLVQDGAIFQSTMDTEVVTHLTARSDEPRFIKRFIDALGQIEGGYAFVGLTKNKLIGARDPWGLRPLVLGWIDDKHPVLASETCALDAVGAKFDRDIENGEVFVFTENGPESLHPFPNREATPCMFEFVYFARPDSTMYGKSIYEVRKKFGRELAKEEKDHIKADVVCPVPDGGNPAALGYSEVAGVPFELGIIRNHYVGRTFIQPTQLSRQASVTKKHAPNRTVLEGKSVVLVDDSIVRGNTSKRIIKMVREAGAKEIHFRVASPPIEHPDYYGIDMPSKEELLAAKMSIEEMVKYLEVDSLSFISLPGFYRGLDIEKRNEERPQFADHCFTGNYPTRLLDRDQKLSGANGQRSFFSD